MRRPLVTPLVPSLRFASQAAEASAPRLLPAVNGGPCQQCLWGGQEESEEQEACDEERVWIARREGRSGWRVGLRAAYNALVRARVTAQNPTKNVLLHRLPVHALTRSVGKGAGAIANVTWGRAKSGLSRASMATRAVLNGSGHLTRHVAKWGQAQVRALTGGSTLRKRLVDGGDRGQSPPHSCHDLCKCKC